jgi:hypothetical protein
VISERKTADGEIVSVLARGHTYRAGDTVRLAADPKDPASRGCSYYLAEIVGFFETDSFPDSDSSSSSDTDTDDEGKPVVAMRTRWFYRAVDIEDLPAELRRQPSEVFWSFHVDINPAASLRGKTKVVFCWDTIPLPDAREPGTLYCRFIYDNMTERVYRMCVSPSLVPKKGGARNAVEALQKRIRERPRVTAAAEATEAMEYANEDNGVFAVADTPPECDFSVAKPKSHQRKRQTPTEDEQQQ